MKQSVLGEFSQLTQAPPVYHDVELLKSLGRLMTTEGPPDGRSEISAGYVYFGQFIAHDITRLRRGDQDPGGSHQLPVSDLVLDRTPRFDLDSIYGNGWDDALCAVNRQTGELELGATVAVDAFPSDYDDLPRDQATLKARIPDNRNDENLFVAQLHVLFHKLHNRIVAEQSSRPGRHPRAMFEEARSETVSIYQQIVHRDFLGKLTDPRVLKFVEENPDLKLLDLDETTRTIPVEFSMAAFRFGHSMVLPSYPLDRRPYHSALLNELFELTGEVDPPLQGHPGLRADCVVEWRRMFDSNDTLAGYIDPFIVDMATPVPPGQETNLAIRNLLRGNQTSLPSAQGLISALEREFPWTQELIKPLEARDYRILDSLGFIGADRLSGQTPLWFYILLEAQIQGDGDRLGTLGSLIVCSTILEILRAMPDSIVNTGWVPAVLHPEGEYITLMDVVEYIQPGQ